ncbi:beta-glucosidase (plasmid) [Clavibacter michiganensis subsp. insidiosus]|uniref:Beta-glucosidase n=3 Tax=Clavibacter michiganensis TaxID=28447 RepID=A0A0D5CM78_9MICO|nr:beta-glucosidase [Clavibacter michiganensis subsp. insidiosus]AWF99938.1 glycosyl hydrolase [Clavibacter michiganensis subsp. insidiosus]
MSSNNAVEAVVATLTVEQRSALTSGASFWTTKAAGSIPAVTLEDGPHGVRHQSGHADRLGISPSEQATCFPPATALAQTWDVDLVERVGEALGIEARHHGVGVLLGPGVNIKRDPRCGRNFEYFSEDPLVSGRMGAAWVRGVQRQGVGASLKHFAANNQESERMRVSADVDERPLREICLRSFERVVREAAPWTVMASYNRLNGVPTTEHPWLLTDVLRDEWGFEGAVVSDWGAVSDRPSAIRAGLDLQMPGGDDSADEEVAAAVREGRLSEDAVTRSASRIASLADRATRAAQSLPDVPTLPAEHHELAREVAGHGIVLLRNDDGILPVSPGSSLAVIGPFARQPRIQGGGSSRVNPTTIDVPLDEIRAASTGGTVSYAEGYRLDGADAVDLEAEAVAAAAGASKAVLFVGLGEGDEIEGSDRSHIQIPAAQIRLVESVLAAQPLTIVVLVHGGVLELSGLRGVPGLLDCSILGQAGGGAIADVLYGVVNPSGRLAETVPMRLEDAPSYLNFPGDGLRVRYGEGIFVGYRGYDRMRREVEFPFGHGLSYTTFSYGRLSVQVDGDRIVARLPVTNTGDRDGREVVQVYSSKCDGMVRPPTELRGFAVADIAAGATQDVEVVFDRSDLRVWDVLTSGWILEGDDYVVHAAASSRDLRRSATITLHPEKPTTVFTGESTVAELLAQPASAAFLAEIMEANAPAQTSVASEQLGIDAGASALRIPVNRIRSLSGGRGLSADDLSHLLALANGETR